MEKSRILENFLDVIESKFTSESTLKTYSNVAEKFIYDKHPNSLDCLTSKYIKRYLLDIKVHKSVSYHNQYLSVIKIIYRDVLKQKYKVEGITPIKVKRKLKTLLKPSEINTGISRITNYKHYTIVITFLTTGIRISELLDLQIKDIDSVNKRILIRDGKGGKSRFVRLTDKLLIVLRTYYKTYKPKQYLFEGTNGKYSKSSINKFLKKYFGSEFHAHLLRHNYTTYMINQDVHPEKLRQALGHKDHKTTAWYYQYSEYTLLNNINPINELQYEYRN
jgi:integrase/recombinase XerD